MGRAGRLVPSETREALGEVSLYEARLFYVAASVASLGADCIRRRCAMNHRAELFELLTQAGEAELWIFRVPPVGSARELYTFNIDNAGAY